MQTSRKAESTDFGGEVNIVSSHAVAARLLVKPAFLPIRTPS
ncbi:hypothetical protein WCP94_003901 [Bilophila wadsworthia]